MIAVCFLPQRRRPEAGGLGPGLRPQLTLATPTFSVSCSMVQSGCCCCSGHRNHVLANGGEREDFHQHSHGQCWLRTWPRSPASLPGMLRNAVRSLGSVDSS